MVSIEVMLRVKREVRKRAAIVAATVVSMRLNAWRADGEWQRIERKKGAKRVPFS
jgi:hypothetical protein